MKTATKNAVTGYVAAWVIQLLFAIILASASDSVTSDIELAVNITYIVLPISLTLICIQYEFPFSPKTTEAASQSSDQPIQNHNTNQDTANQQSKPINHTETTDTTSQEGSIRTTENDSQEPDSTSETSDSHTVSESQQTSQANPPRSIWINATIGAVVTTVMYFIPLIQAIAPIFGGFTAGYLQKQGSGGGIKAGGLKGFIMTVPAVFLAVIASGLLTGIPVIGELLAGSILIVVIAIVAHSVLIGFIGGLFGGLIGGNKYRA